MRYMATQILDGWFVEEIITMGVEPRRLTLQVTKEESQVMAQALNCQLDCDQGFRESMIEEARRQYGSDEINIDDDAGLSEADADCWVQAWVWLEGVNEDDEEDDEEDEDE